eukprot:Skav232503  [mRNA]  locus=scaffold1096:79428:80915:+ [translate_table: standard]
MTFRAFDYVKDDAYSPEQLLSLGVTIADLEEFFRPQLDFLCSSFEGIDLPEAAKHPVSLLQPLDWQDADRLVIYTDGSSFAPMRWTNPTIADEAGKADAWAFLVLAERYLPEGQSQLGLVGWTAQPVLCSSDSSHCIGSDRIGSEVSECEALFWAALWRLRLNTNIPTIFRTDSATTGKQATGHMGTAAQHVPFLLLRGTFQALQAQLPADALRVEHVHSHAGEPWNELIDHLVQFETRKSFHLSRQNIDMQKWIQPLQYMWMIFDKQAGLPDFGSSGFDIAPPALPARHTFAVIQEDCPKPPQLYPMNLSVVSMNVNSLYNGPTGHGGKLQFLQERVQARGLRFAGVQEARSDRGTFGNADFLRFASGHDRGQFGVELWVNLRQPFARLGRQQLYFSKTNFAVVHADPRLLIVKLHHELLSLWLWIGHAPHCGMPPEIINAWWNSIGELLQRHGCGSECIGFLDANAKSGEADGFTVLDNDDEASMSTPALRSE